MKSTWVKIEEGCEMPGNFQRVLAGWDDAPPDVLTETDGGGTMEVLFIGGKFRLSGPQVFPSHWQPLPAPPTEDTE